MAKRRIMEISWLLLTLALMTISSANGEVSKCSKTKKTCALLDIAADLILKAKENYIEDDNDINSCKLIEQPIDCYDLRVRGYNVSGLYGIWPRCRISSCKSIDVYCDMETDGGGWTVIQRRGSSWSSPDSFYKDWQDYKTGFGDIDKDFWLGNENIFSLSNQGLYSIRFDITDKDGESRYAVYDIFAIDDENKDYRIHIKGYSGNAGDSMKLSDGRPFSTKDRKTDEDVSEHCSLTRRSAWWFKDCTLANLNGLYMPGVKDIKSMYWSTWQSSAGMKYSSIKIRPKNINSFM